MEICNVFSGLLCFAFLSCSTKVEIRQVDVKLDNQMEYKIEYPSILYKDSLNFIKLYNYKSSFDTIKGDRIPVLYLVIEDSIIKQNVFKMKSENKLEYVEHIIPNDKFEVPYDLLKNKTGKKKLSVIITDIHFKEGVKEGDEFIDKDIPIQFIDSRSFFDIDIR